MRVSVGIDPATEGAASILVEELGKTRIEACIYWKKLKRKKGYIYKVKTVSFNNCDMEDYVIDIKIVENPSEIGLVIASHPSLKKGDFLLSCEDSYVHINARTAIWLARFSGLVCAPLEVTYGVTAHFVKASVWRNNVLGLNPYTKRKIAKQASLTLIPKHISGMLSVLSILGLHDHVTDSAGIAKYRLNIHT